MVTFYDAKLIQSIYFEDRWLKYPTDSVFLFLCFTCLFSIYRIKRQPILPISHYQILGVFFPLILIDFRMTVYKKSIFFPQNASYTFLKFLNGCWMYTHFPKRNKNNRILAKTLQHLTNLSHRSTNIILFWKMKIRGVCIGGGGGGYSMCSSCLSLCPSAKTLVLTTAIKAEVD